MVSLRGWLPDVRNPLNIRPSAKPPVGQSSTGGAFCLSKTLWASTTFKSGALAKQRPKTWNMEQYWTVAVLMKWKAGAVYEERDSYQPTLVWSVLSFPGWRKQSWLHFWKCKCKFSKDPHYVDRKVTGAPQNIQKWATTTLAHSCEIFFFYLGGEI